MAWLYNLFPTNSKANEGKSNSDFNDSIGSDYAFYFYTPQFSYSSFHSFWLWWRFDKNYFDSLFLDAYSEGWLYTMGFALFLSSSKDFLITKPNTYCKALFYLIIPIFILVCLRSSIFLFPKIFQILILAASFLWGVLQIIVILDFFSKGIESKIHFFVLFLVLCKASLDIAVSFPITTFFLQSKLFGILYLHIKLLGIMSVVILLFIFRMYFTISKYSLYSRIFLMIGVILSLMGMLLVAISSLVNGYNMNYVNNQQIWQIGQSFALLGGLSVLFSGGLNIYYLFIKRSLLVLANEN